MRRLAQTYTKNGYEFNLIERLGDVCIYAQCDEKKILAYEVFEVQKLPERHINGKVLPATEACPSASQWGQKGYTFHEMERAKEKMAVMFANIQKRKIRDRYRSEAILT